MKLNTFLETILCDQGIVHNLSYHQQRLNNTLQKFNISANYNLLDLLTPPDNKQYRCRFIYDASSYQIEYHPYIPKKITSLRLVYDDTIEYSSKYFDRNGLNKLFEARDGCDNILIVKNGYLTDTTIANIAFLIDNEWLTPQTPLLEGTTRARLIDEGKIIPAPLNVSDLLKAQKIALMNAMIGFIEMENGTIS